MQPEKTDPMQIPIVGKDNPELRTKFSTKPDGSDQPKHRGYQGTWAEDSPGQIPPPQICETLCDNRFKVQGNYSVQYSIEEGLYVAETPEFREYGYGKSAIEALDDLQKTLVELYLSLRESADRLGPDLQKTWQNLQQKFVFEPR